MANQVAGSQTKLATDVAQLKTDVESLNSNITSATPDLRNKSVYSGDVHTADPGWYRVAGKASNLPIAAAGYLLVIVRANDLKCLQYTTDSGRTFTQTYNGASWTNWQELALASNLNADWSSSTNWMTAAEQGSCSRAWVWKVVTVTLLTESRVHAENDVILTLPDGWKPASICDIPAYYRNECCVLRLQTDGTLKIWNLGDTTNAGRIYATFTYIRA